MKSKEVSEKKRFYNAVAYASSSDNEDSASGSDTGFGGKRGQVKKKGTELPTVKESTKPKQFKGIPLMQSNQFFEQIEESSSP